MATGIAGSLQDIGKVRKRPKPNPSVLAGLLGIAGAMLNGPHETSMKPSANGVLQGAGDTGVHVKDGVHDFARPRRPRAGINPPARKPGYGGPVGGIGRPGDIRKPFY